MTKAWDKLMGKFKKNGYQVKLTSKIDLPGIYAYGVFMEDERLVLVRTVKRAGRLMTEGDRLFVLAHEYRHLQHKKQGLYRPYYADDNFTCSYEVALEAERDCDRWARAYLKKHGIRSNLSKRTYPIQKTTVYRLHKALTTRYLSNNNSRRGKELQQHYNYLTRNK